MTTYNGHNALESVSDVDAVASDPTFSSKSTTKSYISVDADSYSSLAFGTVTHVTTPIDSTISTKIEPPRDDRYGYANNGGYPRSEEHTSELQSLMRSSYAVFCLKKQMTAYKFTHMHR